MRVIYLDTYFLLNFCMDGILVTLTGLLCNETARVFRLLLAAALGAVGACLTLVIGNAALRMLLGIPVLGLAMLRTTFPHLRFRQLLRATVLLTGLGLLFGGLLNWLYYQLPGEGVVSMKKLLCSSLAAGLVIALLILEERRRREKNRNVYSVCIRFQEQSLVTEAFFDSGNLLQTPDGEPVHILEANLLTERLSWLIRQLENGEDTEQLRFISCRTLGGQGKIAVLRADQLLIPGKKRTVILQRPLLGLTQEQLFTEKNCHMLLNGSTELPG